MTLDLIETLNTSIYDTKHAKTAKPISISNLSKTSCFENSHSIEPAFSTYFLWPAFGGP